ncbi:MAG: pre-peptidase C-terminal domain-containing protein, partial [Actinomycetota bacterium]
TGAIGTAADVDAFSVTVGAGTASFSATPAPVSPDLDIRLVLRDGNGTLVASADPASGATGYDSATGMAATLTATLAAGTYTVSVEGVGWGSATLTGYSDYGSLGHYSLTGTAATSGPNLAPPPSPVRPRAVRPRPLPPTRRRAPIRSGNPAYDSTASTDLRLPDSTRAVPAGPEPGNVDPSVYGTIQVAQSVAVVGAKSVGLHDVPDRVSPVTQNLKT